MAQNCFGGANRHDPHSLIILTNTNHLDRNKRSWVILEGDGCLVFVRSASRRLTMFTKAPVRLVLVRLTMNKESISGGASLVSAQASLSAACLTHLEYKEMTTREPYNP